jgi:putative Mn2+ efflux pump MntP
MLLLGIAICVSIDSLLAGMFLGFKKIKVSFSIYLVAFSLFLLFSFLAYLLGAYAMESFSQFHIASKIMEGISNGILLLLGCSYIFKDFRDKRLASSFNNSQDLSLQHPVCDLDRSGSIDFYEVILLALILSVDTVIAVISLSIAGSLSLLSALFFGFIQCVFILGGVMMGKVSKDSKPLKAKKISFLKSSPGYFLLLAVFFRILFG